ncbi:hypothetical protein DFP93_103175 [Aneurinibacillus soli]|uniref:Uncharacterized protein n=1 Tax=Aneurinibacillus soli TaxID=1500254 RepID=A0A0U5AZ14_9BACL|nr:hypothetical protein [Aneurinibacillus soli]PYE62964.1 hypothetical protein DFP93_103175 [Aneurinibacillus soli]BAU28977.1 hypothetical protein CB4_03155 [Aneurinibacillus soli]
MNKKPISEIFSDKLTMRELPADEGGQSVTVEPDDHKVWIVAQNRAFEIDITGLRGLSVKSEDGRIVSVAPVADDYVFEESDEV